MIIKSKANSIILTSTVLLLVVGLASPAYAVPFTGTTNVGSGVQSPIFGTLIDFDDQASGTTVGAQDYLSQGIASITETRGGLGDILRLASGVQSSPNYISTCTGAACDDGGFPNGQDGTFLFECVGLASVVGIGVANGNGVDILNIYDGSMQLLETQVVPVAANVYVGFDRLGQRDIKFLEIVGDFFAVDDLQQDCEATLVGGELLQIDNTALLLAGLQTSMIWMLPVIIGATGVSAFYIKTRMS